MKKQKKRPNVVIIQTDQQSMWSIGAYGGTEVKTPYIDSLAEKGLCFENFYTVSAVCTPSRGCFLTGQYPHIHGAYRNDLPIKEDTITFAQSFKDNGYQTIYIGKWHLDGDARPGWIKHPKMGFVDCEYMFNCSHDKKIVEAEKGNPQIIADEIGDEYSYTTDFLTDRAIEKMKMQADQPFLLMLSLPDPHQPYQVRAPYDTMYQPADMQIPKSFYQEQLPDWAEQDEWGRWRYFPIEQVNREQELRRIKALYCGEVKCIDDNVGKILNFLKKQNQLENTMVIFTSDHGEYMGEHGLLEKNNLYDSVYRIPLLISWPHYLQKPKRISQYVSIIDFAQTLLTLVDLPLSGREQGRDAGVLWQQEYMEMDDLVSRDDDHKTGNINQKNWENCIYIYPSDVPRAGIITEQYQLCYVGTGWAERQNTEFTDHILFDRRNDPEQMKNLFFNSEFSDIIKELSEQMIGHFRQTNIPLEKLPRILAEKMKKQEIVSGKVTAMEDFSKHTEIS